MPGSDTSRLHKSGAGNVSETKRRDSTESNWILMQEKTFTNWINDKLKETKYSVGEITKDLGDGVILIALLLILAPGKKMPRKYKINPRMDIQKRENLDIAFQFLSSVEKVPLVNIGVTDIYQGNLKLILGLVWALILRYQIAGTVPTESVEDGSPAESKQAKKKKVSAKKLLLDWVNATLPHDDVTNFTTNWNDGLCLSSLVDYCKPGLIPDHASLNPDNRLQNVSHAMDLAEKELGVPKLLSPEDLIVDKPDELSVMTYISGFCRPGSAGQNSLLDWVNRKIPNHPVSNFTTDWTDGTALAALVDAVSEAGFPESDLMKKDDNYKNCQEAMDAAKSLLAINSNFPPEDFAENSMDQITRSTYITKFRHAKPLTSEALTSQMKAVGPGITGDSIEKETSFVVRGPRIPQWAKIEIIIKGPDGSELPVRFHCINSKATQFHYTPKVPGDYVIKVHLNGQPIPDSPFALMHVSPTNANGCTATGSGLKKARVGETTGFNVDCKEGGVGELKVVIKSPSGKLGSQMKNLAENDHNVNYTPKESGEHFISVMWDKKNISSSPFSCIVTDPKQCSVTMLPKAFISQPQTFTVKTDKAGLGELVVEVYSQSGSVDTAIKPVSKNVFNVTYFPQKTVPHHISVHYADAPVPGSPFIVNVIAVIAPANASKCTVSNLPEGRLRVGKTYSFEIDATQAGSGEMTALAQGPTVPESCSIKECGDSLYVIDFMPAEIGPLKVEVEYGGDKIPQCPLQFTCNDPTKVKVNTSAVKSGSYFTNQPIQFVVSATHAGEGDLLASIRTTADDEKVELKDQGGKSYLFNYLPRVGGSHAIDIKFDDTEIPDMPIRIFVDNSNLADKVVVTQPLASKIGAYLVDTSYIYKVITTGAGHEVLEVKSTGSRTGIRHTIKISDDGNDQFSVVFTASAPDEYIVNMRWGGEHVPASPFKLLIEGKPKPENVVCVGPLYTVGSREPVTLEANAEKAGAGKLSATCRGNEVGEVPVNVVEQESQRYKLSFLPPKNDIYSLNVLWQMGDVKESPFKINLIPPDATKCIVVGPEVPIDPTGPILLHVDASEAGNGKIAASVHGDGMGAKDVMIEETKPNVFVLSFVPELMDFYTMEVLWGDNFVPGAPFRVNSSAANAKKVFICEPPSASHEANQGIKICFDTSAGGRGILTAACKGENTGKIPIRVNQQSKSKDKYDICFLPTMPDIYVVNVFWNGVDAKGSPFTINLMPIDLDKIKLIGPNMSNGPEGAVALTLQAVGAGKGKVKAICNGNSVGPVEVAIKESSTDIFELRFIPPKPDIFKFSVQYGGKKLKDSPFVINTLLANASLVKVKEPDIISLSKQLIYNVDTTKAGSGSLTTTCHGEKHGPVKLTTTSKVAGYYDVSFIPKADLYTVIMKWCGKEVPDSPFQIDLRPPISDRVKVGELHVPDRLCDNSYVWLDLDCMGAGQGSLKGESKGKMVGNLPVIVDQFVKSQYRMKFLPKQADIYTFAVAYGDQQVTGSPFKINLFPPNASEVKHTRTVLPEMDGGPVVMFFNTTNAGRGEMTAEVKNDLNPEVTNKVEQVSFTEHKISFVADVPDIYDVNVKWSGDPVDRSPFKVDTRLPLHLELVECGRPVFTDINDPVNLSLNTFKAGPGKVTAKCINHDGSPVPVEVLKPTTPSENYKVSFLPKGHGRYDLFVYFDGNNVKESPFLVDITLVSESCHQVVQQNVEETYLIPEEFQVAESTHEEKRVSEYTLEIGAPFSVTVSSDKKDKSDTVTASVCGDNTGPHDVEVTKNDTDNTFCVYFSPTVPDRYSIDIAYNGVPLLGSPYTVNYTFPIDPSKCRIFGLQNTPPILQVNEPINFGVDAKEAGEGELLITIDGLSSKDELDARPSDKGEPGIYSITYIPTVTGKHQISLLWSGDKISGSPLMFEVCDVRKIERLPYGKPVTLEITASMKTGNLHAHAIHEESETKSKVKLSKQKNGKLKLAFQPKQPGIYAIHTLLKKNHIPGSPIRIRYLGPSNPKGVLVSDFSGKGFMNHPYNFTINAEKAGTGELAISVEDPKGVSDLDTTFVRNEESRDICYNVCFIPQNHGEHQLVITWSGIPIPLGPYKVDVTEDKPKCKTVLQGEAINVIEVGQPANVIFSSSCVSIDPESISADCEGDRTGKIINDISIQKKGSETTYVVQFVPTVEDDYTFSVKHNDSHINGSPFTIKTVKKDALSPAYAHPDKPQHCDIVAGKLVNIVRKVPELEESPTVLVSGPIESCPSTVTTDSDGGLGVQFLPPLPGSYTIEVVDKDGSSIHDCPCKITVIRMHPDSTKVVVVEEDLPLFDAPVPFGKPACFRISTVDASSGTLSLTAKGPGQVTVTLFENQDRIYTCDLTSTIEGKYLIDILWNDNHIQGSPYMLHFKTNEYNGNTGSNSYKGKAIEKHLDSTKVFVLEEDLPIFDGVPFGEPACFRISTADAGTGTLNLRAEGPGKVTVNMFDNQDGTEIYTCNLTSSVAGEYLVDILWNENHIRGSPYILHFNENGSVRTDFPDASKCVLVESFITGQNTDEEKVNFVVSTKGAGTGKLSSSVDQISSKTSLPVIISPLPDSKYKVEFSAEEDKEYLLSIKYDNQHIPGSTFKLMFGGDVADAAQCSAVGDGIEACMVDKEATFTVNTVKPNQGALFVTITGRGKMVTPKIKSFGDTTTEVSYMADIAGKYDVSIKWAQEEIPGSPFLVECYDPSDSYQFRVEDPPNTLFHVSRLTFTVKSVSGRPEDGSLVVSAQSPQNTFIHGHVEDVEDDDSSYKCTLDLPDIGKYLIYTRWNGSHIRNSPFKLKVVSMPRPNNVRAYGPGLENGFIGEEGNFTVETADGGSGTLAVRVFGPKKSFKMKMHRHRDKNRTVLVSYNPNHIGKYQVYITWSEVNIPGSPFKVQYTQQ